MQARHVATRLKSVVIAADADATTAQIQRMLLALGSVMLRQPQSLLQPPHKNNATERVHTEVDFNAMPLPISLALVKLECSAARPEQTAYELHVRGEAMVAAALVRALQKCSPSEDIFVATPHRVQRAAVNTALRAGNGLDSDLVGAFERLDTTETRGKVIVDTVEKLQGITAFCSWRQGYIDVCGYCRIRGSVCCGFILTS